MLKRIRVHNYRTFVDFEWSPPQACAVVGENGAGKSALIEVLWLVRDIVGSGVPFEYAAPASTRTAWLDDREQFIELDVEHEGESFEYRLAYQHADGKGITRETLKSGGDLLYCSDGGRIELYGDEPSARPRTTIPFDAARSFLAFLEPRDDNRRVVGFREFVRRIRAYKPDALRIAPDSESEAHELNRNLANFADWYRSRAIEDPEANIAFHGDLQRVLKGFVSLRYEPITPRVKELRAVFEFGSSPEHGVRWTDLSDGQRLLIALYGVLRFALTDASFIALDEVENYVAPPEIQPWLRAVVDEAADRRQQVLVASHHPEAIDYMAAGGLWRMVRDETTGSSRIVELEPDLNAGETAYDMVKYGSGDA